MAPRPVIARLLEDVGATLNALPGVFSTPQWGGRAYKLPGRGGRRDKPKLVAFVAPAEDGRAVTVSFKLDPRQAADALERHDWIEPHSFRTLAPSGWVTAILANRRQASTLRPLLAECHALLAPPEKGESPLIRREKGGRERGETPHIDSVMEDARSRGWSPPAELADGDGWVTVTSP